MEAKEMATLKTSVEDLGKEIKGLLDRQDAEIKATGKTSSEVKEGLEAANKRWSEVEKKMAEMEKKMARADLPAGGNVTPNSIGAILVASSEFKAARERGAFTMKPVGFETKGVKAALETKQGELTSAELGAIVRPFRYDQIITPPLRPRKLINLIPSIPVSSNAVEYPVENVTAELYAELESQAAAAQKDVVLERSAEGFYVGQVVTLSPTLAQEEEATIAAIDYDTRTLTMEENLSNTHPAGRQCISHTFVFTPEAKVKPLSSIGFDLETATIKTLATIMPVSKQMLDDAPALQTYIDTRMNEFRELAKESEILYGDNSTRRIQGILAHPGIEHYAWSDGEVGDTKVDAIRRACTLCNLSFLPPDTLVINPNDLEDVELTKGEDGHYLFAQVMVTSGVTQIWRLQVVETSVIEEGHALVGSFRLGCIIWDRMQAEVSVSDQNRDWWEKNLLGIRLEERMALSVTRPKAFVDVHFDAEPEPVVPPPD